MRAAELQGCGTNSFPAYSITAGACALDGDHCQAKIFAPMLPATSPEILEQKVRTLNERQNLLGFFYGPALLSRD